MIADNSTNEKISKIINQRKFQIEEIMQEFHLNIFEGIPGQSNRDYFESKVNRILNKATGDVGNIGLKSLHRANRMTNMVAAGSKGSEINVSQMIACLGQQNVDAKRIPHGFGNRTLPHYQKYDESPDSRGFVENSFIKGLTPQEFFFHAMGGREGLIDTAVKSITGDTKIVIMENNKPINITIGEWIDTHLKNYRSKIKYYGKEISNNSILDSSFP
jgi:DNA-directed RNA polymerase II subunit RPB1